MFTDFYTVNAKTKVLEDAWKFAKFLGGNVNGDWYVQRQWCLIAGPRQPVSRDVRPPGDHPVLRQVDRSQAPARAVQEGQDHHRATRSRGSREYDTKAIAIVHNIIRGTSPSRRVSRIWSRSRSRSPRRGGDRGRACSGARPAGGLRPDRGGVRLARSPLPVVASPHRPGALVVVPLGYSLWLSFTDVNLLRAGRAGHGAVRHPRCRSTAGSASRTTSRSSTIRSTGARSGARSTSWAPSCVEATLVGHGDGARAERALPRPRPDAEPPPGPVVPVPDRGRAALDRHPRLRVRRPQRLLHRTSA